VTFPSADDGGAGKEAVQVAGQYGRGGPTGGLRADGSGAELLGGDGKLACRAGQPARRRDHGIDVAGEIRIELFGRRHVHMRPGGQRILFRIEGGRGIKAADRCLEGGPVQNESAGGQAGAAGQVHLAVLAEQPGGVFGQHPGRRRDRTAYAPGGHGRGMEGDGQSEFRLHERLSAQACREASLPGVEGAVACQAHVQGSGGRTGQGGRQQPSGAVGQLAFDRQAPSRVMERAGHRQMERWAVQAGGREMDGQGTLAGFRQPAGHADGRVLSGQRGIQQQTVDGQGIDHHGRQAGYVGRPCHRGLGSGLGRSVRCPTDTDDVGGEGLDVHPPPQKRQR